MTRYFNTQWNGFSVYAHSGVRVWAAGFRGPPIRDLDLDYSEYISTISAIYPALPVTVVRYTAMVDLNFMAWGPPT